MPNGAWACYAQAAETQCLQHFQNRYKSIVCEDDPYLLELSRYIHLNPVRLGMVEDLAELSTYPWTGHSVIMGKVKRGWQDKDAVLAYFGRRKKEAILGYKRWDQPGQTARSDRRGFDSQHGWLGSGFIFAAQGDQGRIG